MNIRVRVVVAPGARRERIEEVKPNVFSISVREKAERGEANERVRILLARHFHTIPKSVRILSGHRGKNKTLAIST